MVCTGGTNALRPHSFYVVRLGHQAAVKEPHIRIYAWLGTVGGIADVIWLVVGVLFRESVSFQSG